MYLVITHLTRMQPGFICVAGIEPDTGKQIRPVLGRCLTRDLLHVNGGAFEIGALVDLGPTTYVGRVPEFEDHRFSVKNLRHLRRLKPDQFWSCLTRTTSPCLTDLFGEGLQERHRSCTRPANTGKASLGHFQPETISQFGVNFWGKLRTGFSDAHFHPELSVTDLRLYRSDHQTVRIPMVECIANRLPKTPAILAVGLTRAWQKDGDPAPRHWLQVNNIHLQEDPLGASFDSATAED
jgi:hypothetical protein